MATPAVCCEPSYPCADCWSATPFIDTFTKRISVFSIPGMTTEWVEIAPGLYQRRVYIGGVLQEDGHGKRN
jgi:hypothetical protein